MTTQNPNGDSSRRPRSEATGATRHPNSVRNPRRFYLPSEQLARSTVALAGPEGRHLVKVLRGRPGQVVSLYDEQGRTRTATIKSVDRRRGEAELELMHEKSSSLGGIPLELGVGFLRGSKLDEVIRFAASMGVRRIHPFVASRSVATRPNPSGAEKVARWQRIANEACKISPGTTPSAVSPPSTLPEVLERMSALHTRIILWEGSAPPLTHVLESGNLGEGVALLIGPEGGFSEEDLRLALSSGFQAASLGPLVLRSEYAVQTAVIVTLHAAGQLG